MNVRLKTVIIVIAAALAMWLIIALPERINYYRSDNYSYDKKCAELKKVLKKKCGNNLGELTIHFDTTANKLTVSFYENGYRFSNAYDCKKTVEDYVAQNSDFFVNKLKSSVEVQSKTDPFYDYPREMYIYRGYASDDGLELNTMEYLTDAYGIEKNDSLPELDITALVITNYGDFNSALEIARISPKLKSVCFTNETRQPDEKQLVMLKKVLPEDCAVVLNN